MEICLLTTHCCPALSTTVKRKIQHERRCIVRAFMACQADFHRLACAGRMGDSAARALPDRLRCASVNGLNQGGGHGSRRRQSGVRRGARARHAGFGIADVSGSCRVATTELPDRCWRVRMKSVSRAAQGRAGRPAVGVPVSSATGGKAGPMRVAACALAITAAIAASPAHAQYYSVDDGGTPGGNSTNNGATGAGSLAAGTDATSTGRAATAVGSRRRHRETIPSPSAIRRWRLARIACRSEQPPASTRLLAPRATSRWAR